MHTTTDRPKKPHRLRRSRWLIMSVMWTASFATGCGDSSGGTGNDGSVDHDASEHLDASPDAEVNPTRIVTTAVGTIDEAGSAVNGVAYGTFVKALLDGIVASEGVTVAALDSEGDVIEDTEDTALEPGMSLRLAGPSDATRTYTLGFETLSNETVVIVDGTVIRFETRFFTNSASEYIIANKSEGGSATHYCLDSSLTTGTYGPNDDGPGICLELFAPAGSTLQASGYTNFGDWDFIFDIVITETSMSGRYHGFVKRSSGGDLLPVLGFMHSDRVESGGW